MIDHTRPSGAEQSAPEGLFAGIPNVRNVLFGLIYEIMTSKGLTVFRRRDIIIIEYAFCAI